MYRASAGKSANYREDSSGLSSAIDQTPEPEAGEKQRVASVPKRKRGALDETSPSKRVKKARVTTKVQEKVTKAAEGKVKGPVVKKKTTDTKIDIEIAKAEDIEADFESHVDSTPVLQNSSKRTGNKNLNAAESKDSATSSVRPKAKGKTVKKSAVEDEDGLSEHEAGVDKPKIKKKRKTKEEKEAEAMPLAARTLGSKMLIGAHVSSAGGELVNHFADQAPNRLTSLGVHNSITNCLHIGGNAFALFLKSQRKWENPALKPEHASAFTALSSEHSYSPSTTVLPHGSYLVNLAAADTTKADQAYNSFVDDLRRCETLGIKLYNFHPGNTNGEPRAEALGRIASQLNRAHAETKGVVTLLENMAASPAGNAIGGAWEDLRDIIAAVNDKSRVGVCLDTCHAFAAGFDLRTPASYTSCMSSFDDIVGPQYLKAVHLNDSKAPLGAHRDLHQNIGLGFLGLRAFHNIVNDKRFEGLPLVLETPIDRKGDDGKTVEDKGVWAREIKLLESLIGMDPEGREFAALEADLAEQGRAERDKYQEAFVKKQDKEAKAKVKGSASKKSKGRKKVKDGSESELSSAEEQSD